MRYATAKEYNQALSTLTAKLGDIRAQGLEDSPLAQEFEDTINELRAEKNGLPEPRLTVENGQLTPDRVGASKGKLRGPQDKKDYKALFGSGGGYRWTAQNEADNFFAAVFSGRHDPRLISAGMSETVPTDGGFLVPTELAQEIHNVALEHEIVMPRAFVAPMISNTLQIAATEIGDHSVSLFGGFEASYTAELATIAEASPTFRRMELNAQKLTGRLRLSNELMQDMVGGVDRLIQICGQGLAWYRDKAFLKGAGGGSPLGVLNADCLVTVDKETGQDDSTILYENLTAMLSRLHPGSYQNAVWVCHPSTIPQLLQLTIDVGTGGAHYPALKEADSGFVMLTKPVVFSEKVEPLGTKGDIMLCDFSQYVIGLRQGMRFDLSQHVHFSTDELAARLIERHDGQPLWDKALTLEDGSTTVSPFVTLAAR